MMKRIELLILPIVITLFAIMAGTAPVGAQSQTETKRALAPKTTSTLLANKRVVNTSQREEDEYLAFVAQLNKAQQTVPSSFTAIFKVFSGVTVDTLEAPIADRRALTQIWTRDLREETSRSILALESVQVPSLTTNLNRNVRFHLFGRHTTITILRNLDASMERVVELVVNATPENQAQTIRSIDNENFDVNSKRAWMNYLLNYILAEGLVNTSPAKSGILAISCHYKALASLYDVPSGTTSPQAAGQVVEQQATQMNQHNEAGRMKVRSYKTQLTKESALPDTPPRVRKNNARLAVILEDYNVALAKSDQIADRMGKAAILLRNGASPADAAIQALLNEMGELEFQMLGLINGAPAKMFALQY